MVSYLFSRILEQSETNIHFLRTITVRPHFLLQTIIKFIYPGSIEFCNSGTDEHVGHFDMLEKAVAGYREILWVIWMSLTAQFIQYLQDVQSNIVIEENKSFLIWPMLNINIVVLVVHFVDFLGNTSLLWWFCQDSIVLDDFTYNQTVTVAYFWCSYGSVLVIHLSLANVQNTICYHIQSVFHHVTMQPPNLCCAKESNFSDFHSVHTALLCSKKKKKKKNFFFLSRATGHPWPLYSRLRKFWHHCWTIWCSLTISLQNTWLILQAVSTALSHFEFNQTCYFFFSPSF